MNILLYTDPHWCQYSSIVRSRGDKYSTRLENLIASVNWTQELADITNCGMIVCLGDFFDSDSLKGEELTALNDIKWNTNAFHYFIVGNHEMARSDLSYSSSHLFGLIPNAIVVDKPYSMRLNDFTELCFLPYVLENNRKSLVEYFGDKNFPGNGHRIILSHNDIKGIQMGKFESTTGFSVEEIESNCDLFLNGHLHNGLPITNKVINLGNLTGQNFSEDATRYDHCAFVLNTETLKVDCYENPYAFNFYKLDATDWTDFNKMPLKTNSVVTVKCKSNQLNEAKTWVNDNPNIIFGRTVIEPDIDNKVSEDEVRENLSVDHLKEFYDFVIENIGNSEVVVSELNEICK